MLNLGYRYHGVLAAVFLGALSPAVSLPECDFFKVEGGYLESVGGDIKCSSYPSLEAAKKECLSMAACDGFSFGPWGRGFGACLKMNRDGGVTCSQKYVGYHKTVMGCCRDDRLEKKECYAREIKRTEKLVSRGKPTTQSSIYTDKSVPEGGLPGKAVDGDKNPSWVRKRCTHTQKTMNPWWSVDLQDTYDVSRVEISSRDCCPDQLFNFMISVGDSPSASNPTCLIGGAVPQSKTKSFPCELRGRFVTITSVTPSAYLSLCEVEVYAMVDTEEEHKKTLLLSSE
ncbi:hypothetical protein BSKO_05795 [Bryopsis sp. KO-2023]|nr:hypothetical protein BSKO_05795 [Bryopsis sp. KO-2023]